MVAMGGRSVPEVPLYSPAQSIRLWGTSRVFWFYLTIYAFYAAAGLGLIVAGAIEKNGTWPLVTGIILALMMVPMAALFLGLWLRPLVVADGMLRVPKAFGSVRIPLAQIAGVGLIYQYTPGSRSPAGWQLRVWNDSEEVRIGRWIVVAWTTNRAPGTKRKFIQQRDWSVPLAHEDGAYLAASKPAQVARRIYDATLAWQGSSGPLVTRALEKKIVFDPNTANHMAAWWSPDGTMGRAAGLPPFDPAKVPVGGLAARPPQRVLAVLVLVFGVLLSFVPAGLIWSIDQATSVAHPNGDQKAIVIIGAVVLITGLLLSVVSAIFLWRGSRKTASRSNAIAQSTEFSHLVQPKGIETSQRVETCAPTQVPQVRPEVRRARRRSALTLFAATPLFIALGVITPLMLGQAGHLPNGETCAAVLGPASNHPSLACDAWRHHELMVFLWPASFMAIGVAVVIVLQVRAVRQLQRVQRPRPSAA
jgi:hypothetical protein